MEEEEKELESHFSPKIKATREAKKEAKKNYEKLKTEQLGGLQTN